MYYVYTLSYPDGRVFYVGKGQGTRMYAHDCEAKNGVRSHKCNTIRKIWDEGGKVLKKKVFETPNEVDSFIYEWCLINLIYGKETLTNVTDGGEGASGSIRDDEYKLKMSLRLKGRVFPQDHREKLRESASGRTQTEETRRKLSQVQTGKNIPQEQREKIRASLQGRKRPQELMARIIAASTQTWPGFIAPDGTEYRDIYNLRQFCKDHGLTQSAMSLVARGLRPHHKEWRRIDA